MPEEQSVPPPSPKDVLERNPNVDLGTVTAHEKLRQELGKPGVEIGPSYDLEPPLGRNPARFHNRNV